MSDSGKNIRILVLYSEVMPYTLAVLEQLTSHPNIELKLVYWDQKKLTPFSFDMSGAIQTFPRSTVTQEWAMSKLVEFSPHLVWTSGRMDPLYLNLNLEFKRKLPNTIRITGCDNQWEGNWKDRLRSLLGYPLYRKYFTHCWIPGPNQKKFALEVGFSESAIVPNLLTCGKQWFQATSNLSENRILYVGRLAPNKNLQVLIDAFESLPEEILSKTSLRLVGSGDSTAYSYTSEKIEFVPFDSQEKLIQHGLESNLFCLPSSHEPFGVVVHEFAAIGLPLLLSDKVGAALVFLAHGKNGYSFSFDNVGELRDRLVEYYSSPVSKKTEMGEVSKDLASKITPAISAASLLKVIPN